MKNIQVIDDAVNCTYEVFSIDDESFDQIFPEGRDIEFEDDLFGRLGDETAGNLLASLWKIRADKKKLAGIHGTLFFGYFCEEKKPFYPTKKEAEMIANP